HQIDGGADGREVEAIPRANIAPENLAKMQSGAERQRRQTLPKPLLIEMCHAHARGGHRAQSPPTHATRRPPADRESYQYAVADKFQHFATEGMNRARDAIEPSVECCDDHGRRIVI